MAQCDLAPFGASRCGGKQCDTVWHVDACGPARVAAWCGAEQYRAVMIRRRMWHCAAFCVAEWGSASQRDVWQWRRSAERFGAVSCEAEECDLVRHGAVEYDSGRLMALCSAVWHSTIT